MIPNEQREITSLEKEKLELTIYQNPAFAIDEIIDAEVELTPLGVSLFNLYIHDRPRPYLVEDNVYHFKGSATHFAIYFFKFGNQAIFKSPDNIKTFLRDTYKKAYELYK